MLENQLLGEGKRVRWKTQGLSPMKPKKRMKYHRRYVVTLSIRNKLNCSEV